MRPECQFCRIFRTALLSGVLGAVAGVLVLYYGGSRDLSMAATFFAALAPVLWRVRQYRISPRKPQ